MTKEKLLDSPRQNSPANLSQIVSADGTGADVAFRWQSPETNFELNYYRKLQIAGFASSQLVERDCGEYELPLGNIRPRYYWRTRAKSNSGQTSNWSEQWKFTVVKREAGQAIEASDWQVEPVGGNIYIISGKTQAGMVVRAQGRETFASGDGSFRLQISSTTPETAVEIRDEKGNRSGYALSLRTGAAAKRY